MSLKKADYNAEFKRMEFINATTAKLAEWDNEYCMSITGSVNRIEVIVDVEEKGIKDLRLLFNVHELMDMFVPSQASWFILMSVKKYIGE